MRYLCRVSVALLLLLGLFSLPVSAERQTWVDRDYDFSNVKKMLLEEPVYPDGAAEKIIRLQMRDYFYDRVTTVSNVTAKTRKALEREMFMRELIDLDRLRDTDFATAQRVFDETLPRYADIRIQPTVESYRVDKRWREPYSYTTTEYHDVKIKNGDKETIITIPETVVHRVPGNYVNVGVIKVKFEVYDTKEEKMVYSAVDEREAEKEPLDMYKRIVNDFYTGLHKTLKK